MARANAKQIAFFFSLKLSAAFHRSCIEKKAPSAESGKWKPLNLNSGQPFGSLQKLFDAAVSTHTAKIINPICEKLNVFSTFLRAAFGHSR